MSLLIPAALGALPVAEVTFLWQKLLHLKGNLDHFDLFAVEYFGYFTKPSSTVHWHTH